MVTELACQAKLPLDYWTSYRHTVCIYISDYSVTVTCQIWPIWPKSPKVSPKFCGCRRGEGCGLRWCRVLFELWETTVPQGTTGAVEWDQYWEWFMPVWRRWWSCHAAVCDDLLDDDDVYGHDSVLLVLIIPHTRTVTIQSLLSTGKGMGSTSCTTVGSMPSWCCSGGAASAFCVLCLSLACLGKACCPVDSPLNIRFFFFHLMFACVQGHALWYTFKCIQCIGSMFVCMVCWNWWQCSLV